MKRLNRHFQTMNRLVASIAWIFVTAVSAWGAMPLGTTWTYQGRLEQEGTPVNDMCDCQFSLWDDPVAGTQVGPTVRFDGQAGNAPPIVVADGVFSAELDFGPGVHNGEARWLEIAVACPPGGALETLSPRQPLTAAPYALYALDGPGAGNTPWQTSGGDISYSTGHVGIGTAAPEHPLHVETDGAEHAVFGHHTATSLTRFGVAGQSDSTGGRGVFGLATSETGLNTGVWGQTTSTSGRGVLGIAAAGTGATRGVFGQSNSTDGTGVYGFSLASAGTTRGVHGHVNSPDGYAGYFEGGRNYFEGNVGIGTEDPAARLDVQGSGTFQGSVITEAPSGNNDNFILQKSGALGLSNVRFRLSHRSNGTEVWMYGSDTVNGFRNLQSWDYANHRVRFPANGSDLFVDMGAGRVGVGTNSPTARLHVSGADNDGTAAAMKIASGAQTLLVDGNEIDTTSSSGLFLNNNTNHDVILGNGGGRVGIGTASPAERLHVSGDARIDGGITIAPATRHLMLSAAAFELGRNDFNDLDVTGQGVFPGYPALVNENAISPVCCGVRAFANVSLPHGARVTQFSAWIRDAAADHDMFLDLSRKAFGSREEDGSDQMAAVASSNSPGVLTEHTSNIAFSTIDNGSYVYWVRVVFPQGTPARGLELWGVRITYTVATPLP